MPPQCVTVLAAIRPGRDTPLRGTLQAIGDDINGRRLAAAPGRPHIDFARSQRIHFARFAILDDPDRGPGRTRLLYAAVYDGPLAAHLDELAGITSDLDAIWGACEGYTGAAAFPAFMTAHAHEPEAYYIAFRDQTVASIRHAISVRRQATSMTTPAGRPTAAIAGAVRRLIRAAPVVVDVARAIRRFGLRHVYAAASGITASLDRYRIIRLMNWVTGNWMAPRRSAFSSVAIDNCAAPKPFAPGDEFPSTPASPPAAFREDVIAQNQLTLVTVVAHGRVDRLRAVMAAIDAYARRLSPPGSLTGIKTIHFVRWLVIDNGRRLLFLSDYDNSWENYIDEFAEMILSGLDAIWDTALGFPPDGARDLPAFKRFLRCHQVPAEVFFSAYPGATVLNIAAGTSRAGQS